jgi:hypothetical protein
MVGRTTAAARGGNEEREEGKQDRPWLRRNRFWRGRSPQQSDLFQCLRTQETEQDTRGSRQSGEGRMRERTGEERVKERRGGEGNQDSKGRILRRGCFPSAAKREERERGEWRGRR